MKLLVNVLLAGGSLLLAHESPAQTKLPPPRRGQVQPHRLVATTTMVKDGVTMQNGKLLYTQMGNTITLDQNRKLLNGTLISTTGLVTHPDGTTEQIKEGDQVSLSGRLTTGRSIAVEDSLRKLAMFDLKHPGKRKELEKDREKADKEKARADKEKAKLAEEKAKKKAKESK